MIQLQKFHCHAVHLTRDLSPFALCGALWAPSTLQVALAHGSRAWWHVVVDAVEWRAHAEAQISALRAEKWKQWALEPVTKGAPS
eukprot:2053422-Amphidinium_carterae.1